MAAVPDILRLHLGIAARSDERAVLRVLVELGRQCVGADEGSLLVLDRETDQLVFAMTCGSRTSEEVLRGQRVPLGRGLTGLAAATGEVQIGAPTYKDVRQRRRRGGAAADPTAVLAAPMLVGGETVGVLTAASFRPGHRFTARDGELYGRLAAVAGVVVGQQQRLAALTRAGDGRRPGRPFTARQRAEAEVVGSVTRLVAGSPRRLAEVAALLAALEPLCREGRS